MNSIQTQVKVPVVFFDGYCNLCTSSVLFIIRHAKDNELHFASLQSKFARQTLSRMPLSLSASATLVLLEDGAEYYRSDAALGIARYLKSPWRYMQYLSYVPRTLRDVVYNLVARYRYSVFGKRSSCLVPTPELRSRFLDDS